MPALEISTARDAQRLRCPNGHVVEPTNEHWYCYSCARHWEDCESEFCRVRDAETGEMVSRRDVEFSGEARHRVPT
jgi:hypothetical protein